MIGHLNIVGVDILSKVKSRQIVLSEKHELGETAEFFLFKYRDSDMLKLSCS